MAISLDGASIREVAARLKMSEGAVRVAHHRGQLTVYLRLNDASVPAIYGPSADEEH